MFSFYTYEHVPLFLGTQWALSQGKQRKNVFTSFTACSALKELTLIYKHLITAGTNHDCPVADLGKGPWGTALPPPPHLSARSGSTTAVCLHS